MSGRQTRPGKTRANTTLPRQNYPPRTVPPSKSPTQPIIPDRSTRLIQNHPPRTGPPSRFRNQVQITVHLLKPGGRFGYWRAILSPEGSSVAGGLFDRRRADLLKPGKRFRPRRVITSARQTRPGKIRDNNTLPEHFRPPDSGHKQPFRPPQTKLPSQYNSTLRIPNPGDDSR